MNEYQYFSKPSVGKPPVGEASVTPQSSRAGGFADRPHSGHHSHPLYPLPIAPEKFEKAVQLYRQYKLEEILLQRSTSSPTSSFLNVQKSPYQRSETVLSFDDVESLLSTPTRSEGGVSINSQRVKKENGEDVSAIPRSSLPIGTPNGLTDSSSVISFEDESPLQVIPATNPECIEFTGRKLKPRKRKALSRKAKAKAALIRCLGSCSLCHSRKVPCPLEHHDIQSLEGSLQSIQHDHKSSLGIAQNVYEYPLAGISGGIADNQLVNVDSNLPLNTVNQEDSSIGFKVSTAKTEHDNLWAEEFLDIKSLNVNNYLKVNFSTQPRNFLSRENYRLQSVDWTTALAKAVEVAYEAAYGPGPASLFLLSKLYSIFDDESSFSGELISNFSDGSFISDASQDGEANGTSSALGNVPDAPNDLASIPSMLGTGDRIGASGGSGQSSDTPGVKTIRPRLHPSKRVIRRLRCHFNARNPYKYCATHATGNKFHSCAKLGYLTIMHLKEHFKNTHMCSRCPRCGKLFDLKKEQKQHGLLEPSQMCEVKPEEEWPGTGVAENINDKIQERINEKLKARGYQRLEESTKDALELWVSANITEYVGDNPTSQEKMELKNWYLIWLALFPGVPVPNHPFYDGPSEASAEDERFIQVFQSLVEDQTARGQMRSIPAEVMDEILERIRETQVITRTMSRAAQNNLLIDRREENRPMDRAQPQHSPSPSVGIIQRTPEHDIEGPAPKRRRDSSHSLPAISLSAPNHPPHPAASESILEQSHYNAVPQLGVTPFHHEMDLNFSAPLSLAMLPAHNDPWSSSAPRYNDMAQLSPGLSMSPGTYMQTFPGVPGTSAVTYDDPFYNNTFSQGWPNMELNLDGLQNFGAEQNNPDDTPRT